MSFSSPRRIAATAVTVVAILIVALALVALFFPWDSLRGSINRYVSAKTERKFEITRNFDVSLGWQSATISFDGIEFANPDWARDR